MILSETSRRPLITPRRVLTLLGLSVFVVTAPPATAQSAGRNITSAVPAEATGSIAFVDVTTLPMTMDSLLHHQTVVVRGGNIVAIGPAERVALPPDVVLIDGRNRFLMPGLADMHTHVRYPDDLLLYLAAGVTSILNLSQPINNPILKLKKDVAEGLVRGPALFASGTRIDGRSGDFDPASPFLVRTPAEALAEVQRQYAAGFRLIKAYSSLPADAYEAILAESAKLGITVVGHVPHSVGVLGVVRNGQRMIAHAEEFQIGPGVAPPDSTGKPSTAMRREFDFSRIPEMVRETVAASVVVCATLSTQENIASQWGRQAGRDSLLARPQIAWSRPEYQNGWKGSRLYVDRAPPFEPRLQFQRTLVRQLYEAGGKIILGTDSPGTPVMLPGVSMYDEMYAVSRTGIPNIGVLRAATVNASDFLTKAIPGTDPFGTIEVGRAADLVLLDANPLVEISAVTRQVGVMARGRWYSSAHLRELVVAQGRAYKP